MDLTLSAKEADIQRRARTLAQEVLAPRAAAYDREERFPREQIQAVAKEGWLAMLVPEAHGGAGLGSVAYSLAMTEIAQGCASTAVTMAVTNMVGDAISAWGDDAQRGLHIPKLASAEYGAGSFCLSEPGAGSDAASLKASAERRGDAYVLNGSKIWITSGDQAGVLLVMAKTHPEKGSRGISTFLVTPDMKGFSVGRHEEKMGLRASSTVTINLDEVEVPAAGRLGEEGVGFKVAMRALDGGRIGVGSQALGIGLAAHATAARFLKDHGGGSSEARAKLAVSETELEAARMLVLRAATMKDAGVTFTKEASMAKLYATESANRAVQRAIEIMGPDGGLSQYSVERNFRDVRVTTIYEGTSEVQRLVIARQVLAHA